MPNTRFKLFVLPPYVNSELSEEPEIVEVNVPTDKIKRGPADERFFVVDPQFKEPYGDFSAPPFQGPRNPPVRPGKDGHFTHLDPVATNRDFCAASMYATVRFTLDKWEKYFQINDNNKRRRIKWPFRLDYRRMELIPLIEWDNAQSGYGFLEFGYARNANGTPDHTRPYCLNFDVLAHELGHSIIFSEVGYPRSESTNTIYYGGFHESAADLAALVVSLHLNKIVKHLLDSTKGNLFSENELSRIGEVSNNQQIRLALNYEKMSTVSEEPHELSLPLTGAFFDIFVEMFQKELLAKNLISKELAAASFGPEGGTVDPEEMEARFSEAYEGKATAFKTCLETARDNFGRLLAKTWELLSPDNLDYVQVANAAFDADEALFGGENEETIATCFRWREIGALGNPFLMARFRIEDCRRPSKRHSTAGSSRAISSRAGRSALSKRLGADSESTDVDHEDLERSVRDFCVNDDAPWIDPKIRFPEFKAGTISQLKFHLMNLNATDLQIEIREFAALLDEWLPINGHPRTTSVAASQAAIRAQVAAKDDPMQALLDVVAENFN